MNRESKQIRAAASVAKRAARANQPGRGDQDRRPGALNDASAAPRHVGWGTVDYAPGGRPLHGSPGGKGGARRPLRVAAVRAVRPER